MLDPINLLVGLVTFSGDEKGVAGGGTCDGLSNGSSSIELEPGVAQARLGADRAAIGRSPYEGLLSDVLRLFATRVIAGNDDDVSRCRRVRS